MAMRKMSAKIPSFYLARIFLLLRQTENSKIIVKNLLREASVTVDLNDISIAYRIGRKPTDAQVQDK